MKDSDKRVHQWLHWRVKPKSRWKEVMVLLGVLYIILIVFHVILPCF